MNKRTGWVVGVLVVAFIVAPLVIVGYKALRAGH